MDELDNLKYNLVQRVTSTTNLGIAYIRDEARIRYTIENADVTNVVRVQGRLIGQATWVTLLDITGTDSQVVDVSTYEEIQVLVSTYDSLSNHVMVYASSFDNVSSGGSVSAADVSNTPSGNLAATDVQAALNELQSDINTRSLAITAKDEGVNLTTALSSIDFVGAGVTATNTGGAVTVTIGAGGGPTYLTATAVIDWASIGGDLHLDFPVAVPGALPNDFVVLGLPVGIDGGTVTEAFVSAADVVTIRSHNVISVAVDQPARTYRVLVIQQ